MNPDDMKELKLNPGDLVEVYNDNGSTQAMAQPRTTAKPKQTLHALRLSDRGRWETSFRKASTN